MGLGTCDYGTRTRHLKGGATTADPREESEVCGISEGQLFTFILGFGELTGLSGGEPVPQGSLWNFCLKGRSFSALQTIRFHTGKK